MTDVINKNVLLGVTGGIAAYKSVELARLLLKSGADVQVVMTKAAMQFVSPMTFQAVTGNFVRCRLFDEQHEAAMGHIELARWADLMLIVPATANFMAQMAQGLANDLLSTLYLACPAPVVIAPAMNQQMWKHPATRQNLSLLEERGVIILGPASGEQACGDTGPGRMLEPLEIMQALNLDSVEGLFAGKRVLVTAGPTREAIDPVRFIGNRSSGKMGFSLADAFVREGAHVTLVAGPVHQSTPAGVKRIDVQTALQMYQAVFDNIQGIDIFVACAAVADYRPVQPREQKIKKSEQELVLELTPNPDILADVAAMEQGPFTLGFAAETENLLENARKKLQAKKLDMLAANPVGDGLGFDSDENSLLVLWPEGETRLPVQGKPALARDLLKLLAEYYGK